MLFTMKKNLQNAGYGSKFIHAWQHYSMHNIVHLLTVTATLTSNINIYMLVLIRTGYFIMHFQAVASIQMSCIVFYQCAAFRSV